MHQGGRVMGFAYAWVGGFQGLVAACTREGQSMFRIASPSLVSLDRLAQAPR